MKRKGSGRTKGAGSFVAVHWSDLEKVLKPDATVIVSRRYAEQLQLNCKAFKATTENIQSVAQQIQFAETEMKTVKPLDEVAMDGRTHGEIMDNLDLSKNECFQTEGQEEDDNSQIQISELNW
jgi:hypothetical protein